MRLRTRIAGLAVAIALVPVLFTSLRAVTIATKEASRASAQILVRDADAMASFIDTWTNVTVDELKKHLAEYTPAWAEKISGVPASKIEGLAKQYAKAKPGTLVTYRGAVSHYNGVEAERAAKMLDGILGYIEVKGGTG